MFYLLKKIKSFFCFIKARDYASNLDYNRALNKLQKTDSRFKNIFYYMLEGFLFENLKYFDRALVSYDSATQLIKKNKNINESTKNYLLCYVEYGYANIHKNMNNTDLYLKFLDLAHSRKYNIKDVKKYIILDFPLSES